MNKFLVISAVAVAGIILPFTSTADSSYELPIVNINGQKLYIHSVEDGESLYGIAHKFGWNIDTISQFNPETGTRLKKGENIYYPVGASTKVKMVDDNQVNPTTHTVKSGESIYGIAQKHNVNIDTLYQLNPNARFGIKEGEILIIKSCDSPEISNENPIISTSKNETIQEINSSQCGKIVDCKDSLNIHHVLQGESLSSIARNFNTSAESIFKLNPGITGSFVPIDSLLLIHANSNFAEGKMKQNITRRKVSTSKYKTIDGENWESIARENKISSQELRNENPEIGNLTAGKKIQIPHFEECGEIITIRPNDIRELSEYGLNEIYNEVHGYSDCPETLKVILLANFDENNKKRDLELLRGMLLSINSLSQSGKKLAFKTIDLSRVNPDNVADVLKMESPDILFTTFDKDFPKTLTEFGDNPKKWIVNIFDAKADDWLAHCNIVNVMSPSEMFNAISADYLLPTFSQFAKYVFDPDETRDTDQVSSLIFDRIDDENKIPLSDMSDISNFKYQAGETYVFVPTVTKKSEIASFLKTISEVIENNPMTTFAVIGKPSWIVYSEIFEKQFSKCNTYIPSRFVINNDNQDVKDFNSAFVSTYNESPIRSFPGYALMGYDVAQFFINNYFKNKGDLNYWDDSLISPLQMNIREKRITNRSGLYNNSIYMLHYNDEGLKIVTL